VRPLVEAYDELRLRIDPGADGSYRAHASTGWGEASTAFALPFSEPEIENFIVKVSRPWGRWRSGGSATDEVLRFAGEPGGSAAGAARQFGAALFKAVFREQISELYRDALSQARGNGRGVRITLCLSGSPELIDVPWEYLFDEPDFLAVSAFTPVVRYLDLPRAPRPLLVQPPLRLLGVVSSPADREPLDVERERENLQNALATLIACGAVQLDWLQRPTLGALLKALQTESFHALHYIGHGSYDRDAEQGMLLFEDDAGWAQPVSGDRLGTILHDFSSLRLAILNACEGARSGRTDPFAGVAGALVRRDIPAVVAMQFEISDEAAIVFADGFYRPLAGGSPVDASLAAARLAILAERGDDIEWGTPVLFMRVPDGRIFDLSTQDGTSAVGSQPVEPSPVAGSADGHGETSDRVSGQPKIVINYRRADTSGHALLIADRLRRQFGQENVRLTAHESSQAGRTRQSRPGEVILALIGPDWVPSLRAASSAPHREDFERSEIERALRDLPESVIPVLIDAGMPEPQALPRSLRGLSRLQAAELRHASFERDLDDLVARVQRLAQGQRQPAAAVLRGATALTSAMTGAGAPAPPESSGRDLTATGTGNGSTTPPRPADEPASGPPARSGTQVAAGIPIPYVDHYLEVIHGLADGTVVPLLGHEAGWGRADTLAPVTPLAAELHANSHRLTEVAQRVAVTLGERRLYGAMKDVVTAQSEPNEVHRFLAELPGQLRQRGFDARPQLIINANYDSGLERAFEDANEPFDYAVYVEESGWFVHVPWGQHAAEPIATTIRDPRRYVEFPIDDNGELERTVIVKIHGGADGGEGGVVWRNNYVVTEDHYIDYLPTHNIQDHLPIQILDKLTGSRCLFLGYLLGSWNARVFLRRIWRGRPISENSWAIEEQPDVLEKASWGAVGHVELMAAGLAGYVAELRAALARWPEQG
jgi:CHAT domain/SIR2-like domain